MSRIGILSWPQLIGAFICIYLASCQTLQDIKLKLVEDIVSAKDIASLQTILSKTASGINNSPANVNAVAIVGGGLSGLTACLYLLEEGHNVLLIERSDFLGGNSAKASSGVNGAYTTYQDEEDIEDSSEKFFEDTLMSSKRSAVSNPFTASLIRRMVDDSKEAVEWLLDRARIPPPILVGRMGGHNASRTHRPKSGLAGAAFIAGLESAVSMYKESKQLVIKTGTRLADIERDSATSWRLRIVDEESKSSSELIAPAVIICTGGFGNDKEGESSLLKEVTPDLVNLGSTNTKFTTGDGIKMAREVGAKTIDMDLVQVHPTGFSVSAWRPTGTFVHHLFTTS